MNNEDMLFSVIIPVFNGENYLRQAIESVIYQRYNGWELIVVNDGSTDNSLIIGEEYAERDERITVLTKDNSGVSDARNLGLKQAIGDWVLFLDADDWLEESYLAELNKMICNQNADLYICNHYKAFETERHCIREITVIKADCAEIQRMIEVSLRQSQWHGEEWYGDLRSACGKCFNRQLIQEKQLEFISGLKIGEDMVFVLRYLQYISSVCFINKPFYNYRYNPQSVMNTKSWEGKEQGKWYFQAVESLVGQSVPEGAKADLWLETAERDWDNIHLSKRTWRERYSLFQELFEDELYQRFSIKGCYEYSSRKQEIYAFLIRKKWIVLLMVLSYSRMLKHKFGA